MRNTTMRDMRLTSGQQVVTIKKHGANTVRVVVSDKRLPGALMIDLVVSQVRALHTELGAFLHSDAQQRPLTGIEYLTTGVETTEEIA